MHLPIRAVRGRWPTFLERSFLGRFFRLDPLVIVDANVDAATFSEAMTSIYVGGTIKITGANRHPDADQLLVDAIDLDDAVIVDLGASDGSTSLELIQRHPGFRNYTIADLYLRLRAVRVGKRTALFTDDDTCVLVVGPKLMGWPAESRFVHGVYASVVRAATDQLDEAEDVLLLNPAVRQHMAVDRRVTYRVHDIFSAWQGEAPDVIKVANLLRRLYFDDDDLLRALHVLRDALPEHGVLFIVDNPRLNDPRPRAGIWRREGDLLREVARLGEPEIGDLVSRVR